MPGPAQANPVGRLWQIPLLVVSLCAFAYAVYVFTAPGPGPSADDRMELAAAYLKYDRADAAVSTLNTILVDPKVSKETRGQAHRTMARAIEMVQKQRRAQSTQNLNAIVQQTRMAAAAGAKLSADDHRRLADAHAALKQRREAVTEYRNAIDLDPGLAASLLRRIVEIRLSEPGRESAAAAESTLDELLQLKLSPIERAWALGEKAELLVDRGEHADARQRLDEILTLDTSDETKGKTAYRSGVSAYEMGDRPEAERQLRIARQWLTVRNDLDADAAYLLGRVLQEQGNAPEALSFYRDVLTSHPGSPAAVMARLGRGVCRIANGEDDAGISDLAYAAEQLTKPTSRVRNVRTAAPDLAAAGQILADRRNYQGTLELLGLEKQLLKAPDAAFWNRVSLAYERRAKQIEEAARGDEVEPGQRDVLLHAARQLRVRSGDASFSHSLSLAATDNEAYGTALWRAVELYDNAGAVQSVIGVLEVFTQERPSDPLTPEAMLRLGKSYMAAGSFDKAIASFQRIQFSYPRSRASSQSAVPLAQALIAKGPSGYARAETVLLSLIEDNPALTPEAVEFRDGLLELGQLFYRQGRFEEAIARLDEVMKRYPDEPRIGQVMFLMADAYRKSIEVLLGKGGDNISAASSAEAARVQRLGSAMNLFDRVISLYRDRPPVRDIERAQQKLAYFYRADCAFDLGKFDDAIKFYDQAAFKYQDDASSLAAFVQVVNANVALGRQAEARAANERAKWLLKRMPPEAFSDGSFALSRGYWEQWLKWSGESGLWPTAAGR
jgi:tetratricopeptide (TPR) repeat protein